MARVIDSAPPTSDVGVVNNETKDVKLDIKTDTKVEEKNEKNFSTGKVKIKCETLINKSVVSTVGTITFNEKGIAEVDENIAKKLLSISGYELGKK